MNDEAIQLRFPTLDLFHVYMRQVKPRCGGQWWLAQTDQGCFLWGHPVNKFVLYGDAAHLGQSCAELWLQRQEHKGAPHSSVLDFSQLHPPAKPPVRVQLLYRISAASELLIVDVHKLITGTTIEQLLHPQECTAKHIPSQVLVFFSSFEHASSWLLEALYLDGQIRCALLPTALLSIADPASSHELLQLSAHEESLFVVQVISPSWFLIDDSSLQVYVEQESQRWVPFGTVHPALVHSGVVVERRHFIYGRSGSVVVIDDLEWTHLEERIQPVFENDVSIQVLSSASHNAGNEKQLFPFVLEVPIRLLPRTRPAQAERWLLEGVHFSSLYDQLLAVDEQQLRNWSFVCQRDREGQQWMLVEDRQGNDWPFPGVPLCRWMSLPLFLPCEYELVPRISSLRLSSLVGELPQNGCAVLHRGTVLVFDQLLEPMENLINYVLVERRQDLQRIQSLAQFSFEQFIELPDRPVAPGPELRPSRTAQPTVLHRPSIPSPHPVNGQTPVEVQLHKLDLAVHEQVLHLFNHPSESAVVWEKLLVLKRQEQELRPAPHCTQAILSCTIELIWQLWRADTTALSAHNIVHKYVLLGESSESSLQLLLSVDRAKSAELPHLQARLERFTIGHSGESLPLKLWMILWLRLLEHNHDRQRRAWVRQQLVEHLNLFPLQASAYPGFLTTVLTNRRVSQHQQRQNILDVVNLFPPSELQIYVAMISLLGRSWGVFHFSDAQCQQICSQISPLILQLDDPDHISIMLRHVQHFLDPEGVQISVLLSLDTDWQNRLQRVTLIDSELEILRRLRSTELTVLEQPVAELPEGALAALERTLSPLCSASDVTAVETLISGFITGLDETVASSVFSAAHSLRDRDSLTAGLAELSCEQLEHSITVLTPALQLLLSLRPPEQGSSLIERLVGAARSCFENRRGTEFYSQYAECRARICLIELLIVLQQEARWLEELDSLFALLPGFVADELRYDLDEIIGRLLRLLELIPLDQRWRNFQKIAPLIANVSAIRAVMLLLAVQLLRAGLGIGVASQSALQRFLIREEHQLRQALNHHTL